jgi:Uma2 family endonuclease
MSALVDRQENFASGGPRFQQEHQVGMLADMRTVFVGTRPAELDALIASRRARGLDLFDEVWNGDYHMNPAPHPRHGNIDFQLAGLLAPLARSARLTGSGPFNLGTTDNYRVPDMGFVVSVPANVFVPTAALVIEIVSPGDESFDKLPHYAEFGVEEVVIIDPDTRSVRIFRGTDEVDTSTVLGFTATWLTEQLDWPD